MRRWALVLASALIACHFGPVAHAEWSPIEVTVHASPYPMNPVTACSDDAYGTFVAWNEVGAVGASGVRLQHLLAQGVVDPAWPAAGVVVTDVSGFRNNMGVAPDDHGGAFVWWQDNRTLVVHHVLADGTVDPRWGQRGKTIATVAGSSPVAAVMRDGANGLYVAWSTTLSIRVTRLGEDGLETPGWPQVVSPNSMLTFMYWPRLASAPDGGVYVAWASATYDTTTASDLLPGRFHVRRLTGTAVNVSGWPVAGMDFGVVDINRLPRDFMRLTASLVDIAPDDRGGVFVLLGYPAEWGGVQARLHRIATTGKPYVSWPMEGRLFPYASYYWEPDASASYRVHPDGEGGAVVGIVGNVLHVPAMDFASCDRDGRWTGTSWTALSQVEWVRRPMGGAVAVACKGGGAYGPYDIGAFIALHVLPPRGGLHFFIEGQDGPPYTWYGDAAAAVTRDDSIVFFWSQVREKLGLFARRYSFGRGEVTAVEETTPSEGLSGVRFIANQGVKARITTSAGGRAELFDVNGRRISSLNVDRTGPRSTEITMPGTEDIGSGVYFARFECPDGVFRRRVLVVR